MALPSTTTAQLLAPGRGLASCVRAYVARDTTSAHLEPAQRFNHFPASSFCSITWFFEGTAFMAEEGQARTDQPYDGIVFGGPQTGPRSSYNPGPVRALMVLFFPPAIHALTGVDVARHTDRFCSIREALGDDWDAMAQAVLQARDTAAAIRILEDFLEPRWREAREAGRAPGNLLGDWLQALLMHAATSGWGRSVRNLERRIKAWLGLPMRSARRLHRAERVFVVNRDKALAGQLDWAASALQGGYADQAHLCRETREVTGHSPTELVRKAQEEEGYWIYRIWS
jgi:AraC-like DNA-binding protein